MGYGTNHNCGTELNLMENLTENRKIIERKSNNDTLWISTSSDGRLTRYSTSRKMPVNDGHKLENISLTAYSPQKEKDTFTPARIRFATIASFKARVLSDAEDVASRFGMDIHSLIDITFAGGAGSLGGELIFGRTR